MAWARCEVAEDGGRPVALQDGPCCGDLLGERLDVFAIDLEFQVFCSYDICRFDSVFERFGNDRWEPFLRTALIASACE